MSRFVCSGLVAWPAVTSQQQAKAARDRVDTAVGVTSSHRLSMVAPAIDVPGYARSRTKRLFDIVSSLVVLPVVVVVVAGAGVVSALVFRTWPLFFQQRRGLGEHPFRALKVRSLPRSFPKDQGKLGLDESDLGRWSRLLRHSHVDELPQVVNVLVGSMSMVGPRPMIDEVLHFVPSEDRSVRSLVRPGLTGAWQVSTAGARPLHDCTELDEEYVRCCSFGADLRLLWMTVLVVGRRRSFTPEQVLDELRR